MSRHLEPVRSFLEQLEARDRREGAILAREFSDIKARSVAWKTEGVCSTKAGSQLGNTRKNRYKDVVPYDETRVILSLLQEEGHGDYINANFIRGTDGSQAYIATQGPLPHTLLDFWRLVWEFGVKVILMACQETENGRKKCERYWAQEQEPLQTGPFRVTLMKETPVNADIILRTLQVTFQKESRSVHQLQYMSWPDHGVPSHPDHILAMVEEARRLQGVGPGPLCVHCSAGCGRTGVLCAVDYVRQLLLTQSHPISASSKWSLRCANSGLLQCRQRSSTGSCTTQWPSSSPALSRTPAPTTRTSRRTVPQSARMPCRSGPPQPCPPYPAHQVGFSGASRCPVPRPFPWPTLTPWCRSVALQRAQGRGRGRPAALTPRSTARWQHVPSGPSHKRRTRRERRHWAVASTCALEGLKGHGNRQRSGLGCECRAPDTACRSVMAGLLQPPCCCALCYV
ncbi:tyrosine-protein phosphatase non-receptor type 18 isoform X3 [Psammomys obesus]|uniref:tyrosine-protein phosphatase non-receptor type 18 isoform X3 n=1 Tax=Psammomys obesus TaxID=48139 RepID=UPI002452D329|nr:tyrosine-protein phosphatase non-receptor type 18 isoform X3 [Psammomys obesus]